MSFTANIQQTSPTQSKSYSHSMSNAHHPPSVAIQGSVSIQNPSSDGQSQSCLSDETLGEQADLPNCSPQLRTYPPVKLQHHTLHNHLPCSSDPNDLIKLTSKTQAPIREFITVTPADSPAHQTSNTTYQCSNNLHSLRADALKQGESQSGSPLKSKGPLARVWDQALWEFGFTHRADKGYEKNEAFSPDGNAHEERAFRWRGHFRKDGVRAWIVCATAFVAFSVVWGTNGSFPLLVPTLEKAFRAAALRQNETLDDTLLTKISIISSLQTFFSFFGCLIAGPLCDLLGLRMVVTLGVSLGIGGALLSALASDQHLWLWWLAFGLINGAGNALLEVARPVVLKQHFDRYYSIASGIVACGSAVSYIIFPLAWEAILEAGDPDKSALDSQSSSIGGPTTESPIQESYDLGARLGHTMYFVAGCYFLLVICIPFWSSHSLAASHANNVHSSTHSTFSGTSSATTTTSGTGNSHQTPTRERSPMLVAAPMCKQDESLPCDINLQIDKSMQVTKAHYLSKIEGLSVASCDPSLERMLPMQAVIASSNAIVATQSYVSQDSHKYPDFVKHEAMTKSYSSEVLTTVTADSPAAKHLNDASKGEEPCVARKSFIKWRLLRNRDFLVIVAAHSISYLGSAIPDAHMYNYVDKFYPKQQLSLTLISYGISLFIGNLISGKLVQLYPHVCVQMLVVAVGMWLTALVAIACPLLFPVLRGFWFPVAIQILYGLGDSGQATLFSVNIASIVGELDLAQGLGIATAASGLMSMAGAPLGGFLYDYFSRDYHISFLVAGVILQFSAILFYLVSPRGMRSLGVDHDQEESLHRQANSGHGLGAHGRPP